MHALHAYSGSRKPSKHLSCTHSVNGALLVPAAQLVIPISMLRCSVMPDSLRLMDSSLLGSSCLWIFQARILVCIAIFLLQVIFPTQGWIKPASLALAEGFLTTSTTWEAPWPISVDTPFLSCRSLDTKKPECAGSRHNLEFDETMALLHLPFYLLFQFLSTSLVMSRKWLRSSSHSWWRFSLIFPLIPPPSHAFHLLEIW